jgi:hypothetical protein
VKLEFLEFRGQIFRQKLSKIAVLKGKSRAQKSIMVVEGAVGTERLE